MAHDKKFVFFSLVLTCISILFICISLGTESWVEAEIKRPGTVFNDTVNYGLIKGTFNLYTSANKYETHDIYLTCEEKECAFSCRKTEKEREDEIKMIFKDKHRPNFGCGVLFDNGELPDIGIVPADTQLHTASYAFMGIALLFCVIAVVFEVLNLCCTCRCGIFGNCGMIIYKIVSLVCSLAVIIWWNSSDFYSKTIRIPFVPAMVGYYDFNQDIHLGYTLWILMAPVILDAVTIVLLFLRVCVMNKNDSPPIGMAR